MPARSYLYRTTVGAHGLEDVGLADPMALVEAIAALQSYQLLGSPEGDLASRKPQVSLALAPKSNALYSFRQSPGTGREEGGGPCSHAHSQRPAHS